jgi:hypothetical protein
MNLETNTCVTYKLLLGGGAKQRRRDLAAARAADVGLVSSSERTQQGREDVIARLSHGTHASSATCHMPDPHPTTEPQYS